MLQSDVHELKAMLADSHVFTQKSLELLLLSDVHELKAL
jgi:hypothetical protein